MVRVIKDPAHITAGVNNTLQFLNRQTTESEGASFSTVLNFKGDEAKM